MGDITPDSIAEKERRNAEAQEQLARINQDRVRREQSDALSQKDEALDTEYNRIQAAIAFAKGEVSAPPAPVVAETDSGTADSGTVENDSDDDDSNQNDDSETVNSVPSLGEGN